jgi:hypothetical protein
MLSDDDLERALRRYAIVGPPGELRSAIVATTVDVPGRFEWVLGPAAAAAVLTIWIGIHLAMAESPRDPIRAREVEFVTETLGGDDDAAAYAELVVPQSPKPDARDAFAEDRWREN